MIFGDSDLYGTNFPPGLMIGERYTIMLTDWVLSQETGSRKAAYEGPVAAGATAIEVERFQ